MEYRGHTSNLDLLDRFDLVLQDGYKSRIIDFSMYVHGST